MLYTVSVKYDNGYRTRRAVGHWNAETPEQAIERARRFYRQPGATFTARPYVRRAKRIAETPKLTEQEQQAASRDDSACAVYALGVATGCGFIESQAAWELVGARKRGHGTFTCLYHKEAASLLGFNSDSLHPSRYVNKTLRGFARENPTGRFLLTVRGHALALVDGKLIDNARSSDLRKVVFASRLEKITVENSCKP